MTRPYPFAILTLITGVAVGSPAFAQHTITVTGAACIRETINGRQYFRGVSADPHREYGEITTNLAAWQGYIDFGYDPFVSFAARIATPSGDGLDLQTLDFHSGPPGQACPWPNSPGAAWLPEALGPLVRWNPVIVPTIYVNVPSLRGSDAATGTADSGFTAPLRGCVDDWFVWGDVGEPDPNSVLFAHAFGINPTQTAYMSVSSPYPCEPYQFGRYSNNWWLSERVDFTITVFDTDPPRSDFNLDGAVNVPDVFSFLAAWFAGDVRSDWDCGGDCGVSDIFAYLADYFAGT